MKRHTVSGSLMVWVHLAAMAQNKTQPSKNSPPGQFLPFRNKLSNKHEKFMNGNARYHVFHETKDWLQRQNIVILDLPPMKTYGECFRTLSTWSEST